MSRVVEKKTGAQMLPPSNDQRARIAPCFAHCTANADLRTIAPVFAELATQLEVTA